MFTLVHWQTVAVARWLKLRGADPGRATAFWSRASASSGDRWNRARVKDSTRHWFEISHTDYLREMQRALDELEPVA
jgi:hypothetical protein